MTPKSRPYITKHDGSRQPFSESKFLRSLKRAGVPPKLRRQLLQHLHPHLQSSLTTAELAQLTTDFLRHHHRPSYLRYNLKQALSQLGPSGYPFEQYLAQLLQAKGYRVTLNSTLKGRCVTHEIDILAHKDSHTYLVEAKFHNSPHLRSDVKVALYVHARYQDILSRWSTSSSLLPWLVTNTRFTLDVVTYAQCMQFPLTSWDLPKNNSLRDLVESTQLYPLTILHFPNPQLKHTLLEHNVVTCQQLLHLSPQLRSLLPPSDYQSLLDQVHSLYQTNSD